ncbi:MULTISPECIES: hypothetical protein [Streptomyces]|uniref:hypothetical protein n=1 Tax=Streptomyces TaxID=1883 RepID=UPI00093D369B|nr:MULTISPECIES: hypothetical protein [Streptomyces]MBX9426941.1 hypothetical protein [Streptomyces lateritius]OKJ61713.1 hypothetical protein AMK29_24410 [Streptomyces sp. CB02261]
MRMLLKVQMDTQASNEAIRQGTLSKLMENAMSELRPEAAYFGVENGCRTAYMFFDLTDPSQMPKLSEPFFLELEAKISYAPVMNPEDLRKGLGALAGAG